MPTLAGTSNSRRGWNLAYHLNWIEYAKSPPFVPPFFTKSYFELDPSRDWI